MDVSCRYFAQVNSAEELQEALSTPHAEEFPVLILGGGSNILFTKDYDGYVIQNNLKGIQITAEDDHHVHLRVKSGEIWHQLVLYCIKKGYAGIENLSLIPGLVGAAPMQNIGAYGVEFESVFESLEAVEIRNGETREFSKSECMFRYRDSIFKRSLKGEYFISAVNLKLSKVPVYNTSYGAVDEELEKMGVGELSLKAVSDAVCNIRRSRLPDPAEIGNAGSFFKNPVIPTRELQQLQQRNPDIPSYPASKGFNKVPAGWLIEQAGWRGKQEGRVGSPQKHALTLVNYGGASGTELLEFSEKIRESVKEKFGIELEREVNVI